MYVCMCVCMYVYACAYLYINFQANAPPRPSRATRPQRRVRSRAFPEGLPHRNRSSPTSRFHPPPTATSLTWNQSHPHIKHGSFTICHWKSEDKSHRTGCAPQQDRNTYLHHSRDPPRPGWKNVWTCGSHFWKGRYYCCCCYCCLRAAPLWRAAEPPLDPGRVPASVTPTTPLHLILVVCTNRPSLHQGVSPPPHPLCYQFQCTITGSRPDPSHHLCNGDDLSLAVTFSLKHVKKSLAKAHVNTRTHTHTYTHAIAKTTRIFIEEYEVALRHTDFRHCLSPRANVYVYCYDSLSLVCITSHVILRYVLHKQLWQDTISHSF